MYLNNKKVNNTNIDSELNVDNATSKIKNIDLTSIFKNKLLKYILLSVIVLTVIAGIICLFYFNKKDYFINLIGEDIIWVYKDSEYYDIGYDAYDSKGKKLLNKVKISSNVDINTPGEYTVTYKLKNVEKTRKVVVTNNKNVETYINLIGDDTVNISVGSEYQEYGYNVYDNKSILKYNVKVFNNINVNKKGNYSVVYSVVNDNGYTVMKKRNIIVK